MAAKLAPRGRPRKPRPTGAVTSTVHRILDAAELIGQQPQPDDTERAYLARQLVQATLPHRSPKGTPPIWFRTNGQLTLTIRPGYKINPTTRQPVCIGYPFGTIPRLLMFWITTEAVRTNNQRLELGDTLASFMRTLGLDPQRGGVRSDATRLRDQMERLFRATISFEHRTDTSASWLDMQVAPRGQLWWDPKQPEQTVLFGSWIELGEDFYKAIVSAPVPVDVRALQAFKNSPLALDLYAWATYRFFTASRNNKAVKITWQQLQAQFGADYSEDENGRKNFKRKAKEALRKVLIVYPALRIEETIGGLLISPGHPLIAPKPE